MLNHVTIAGRLTSDVEVRKTSNGLSFIRFTLACNRRFSQGENKQADFIQCIAWRQTADFVGRYARKGSLIGVEGRIQTGSYDDKDGKKVYTTEVVCDNVQLMESKRTNEERAGYQQAPMSGGYNQSQSMSSNDNYDFSFDDGPVLDIASDDLPF